MMLDCSAIQHVAGYDPATGEWVEEYYYPRSDGQVFVFLRNHPPEGQQSQTPPAQVGEENGFCTRSEPRPEGIATEALPLPQEAVTPPPRDDLLGGAGVWILLAIGGAIAAGCAMSNAKEKRAQQRYDAHAVNHPPQRLNLPSPEPASEPASEPADRGPTEDDQILLKLLHQTPVAVAVQEIWGANPGASDYEHYKSLYLTVRRSYESQYPNAKFEDSTL